MQQILFIKGKTKFNITLDSGSWIFDDRKIDLDTYFSNQEQSEKEVVTHEEKESEFGIGQYVKVHTIHQL